MGFFGLGFLIDFVSGPVSSGFTSAVALIILSSQVKDIFGIKGGGNTFVEMWRLIVDNIGGIRMGDTILGFSCIVILLLMRVSYMKITSRSFEIKEIFSPHSFYPTLKSARNLTKRKILSIKSSTRHCGSSAQHEMRLLSSLAVL